LLLVTDSVSEAQGHIRMHTRGFGLKTVRPRAVLGERRPRDTMA
jgi:hypothetical protein